MVGTMSFFMYIFANGMAEANLDRAMEIGGIVGGVTAFVFLCYTSVRYVERNRKLAEAAVEIDPLDRLQARLQSVEETSSSLPWAEERPWLISTHVRRDRGVMTVDLHDLDVKHSRFVVDQIIASREWIGRVRIITGRGLNSKTIPKIRPMVIERLRGDS